MSAHRRILLRSRRRILAMRTSAMLSALAALAAAGLVIVACAPQSLEGGSHNDGGPLAADAGIESDASVAGSIGDAPFETQRANLVRQSDGGGFALQLSNQDFLCEGFVTPGPYDPDPINVFVGAFSEGAIQVDVSPESTATASFIRGTPADPQELAVREPHGTLRFESWSDRAEDYVRGTIDLSADGIAIAGPFEARICPRDPER